MIDRPNVTLADAQQMLREARCRADELGLEVAVAVVDAAGILVALERADGVQPAGPDVAIAKARAAALFRRPSAAFDEVAVAASRPSVLLLPSAVPHALAVAGGVPVRAADGGPVAGAVGVSGGSGEQDADVAQHAVGAWERSSRQG